MNCDGAREHGAQLGPQAEIAVSEGADELNVLVQARADFSETDLIELSQLGLAARTVVGDIATGDLAVASIDAVLSHPCVLRVEASGPLFYETPAEEWEE